MHRNNKTRNKQFPIREANSHAFSFSFSLSSMALKVGTNALASAGVSANQQQATAARMPQAGMEVNTRQALIDNARAELMRPEIEE